MSQREYHHLVRFGTATLEDKDSRDTFYAGLGLCNWHFWELRRSFWGPGLAETLFDVLTLMPAGLGLAGIACGVGEPFPLHSARCWVCKQLARDESDYVATLVHSLEKPDFRATYEQSRGLCLPHVHTVTALASVEIREWIIHVESDQWERLKHDLAELVRKAQPSLLLQPTPSEVTAPARCIQKLVGNHGRPWPMEKRDP